MDMKKSFKSTAGTKYHVSGPHADAAVADSTAAAAISAADADSAATASTTAGSERTFIDRTRAPARDVPLHGS